MAEDTFPPVVQALLAEADDQFQKGNTAEARFLIQKAQDALPDDPGVLIIHGNLLFHLGDIEGARGQFSLALEKAPFRLDVMFSLATACIAAGDARAAEDVMVGVLESPGISHDDLASWSTECHTLVSQLADRGRTRAGIALRNRRRTRTEPPPTATLLVYGNCQADVMASWARQLPEIAERYRVVYHASFGNPDPPRPVDLRTCALFWEQTGLWTKFEQRDLLPPDVPTVRFPPCDFASLWPLASKDPLVKPAPPDYPHGRYPIGNRLVTELTDRGDAGGRDLFQEYQSTDLLSYSDFRRFHDLTVSRIKAREADADVKISDWLLENFTKLRLHWAHYHPTGALLQRLMFGLLERTPAERMGTAWERQNTLALLAGLASEDPLAEQRMPIDDTFAEALGIEWDHRAPIYGIGRDELLSAGQFLQNHIAWRQEELRRRRAEVGERDVASSRL